MLGNFVVISAIFSWLKQGTGPAWFQEWGNRRSCKGLWSFKTFSEIYQPIFFLFHLFPSSARAHISVVSSSGSSHIQNHQCALVWGLGTQEGQQCNFRPRLRVVPGGTGGQRPATELVRRPSGGPGQRGPGDSPWLATQQAYPHTWSPGTCRRHPDSAGALSFLRFPDGPDALLPGADVSL